MLPTGIVIIVFTWNRYNFFSTWTSDINGTGTAVVLLPHIKLDRLALKQHTESIALDVRVVYEDVTAVSLCVVWKNKTKSFGVVEPFDDTTLTIKDRS